MKKAALLQTENELFTGSRENHLAIIRIKDMPLKRALDLNTKELFFEYLRQVADEDEIAVVLMISAGRKLEKQAYIDFFRRLLPSSYEQRNIQRFFNAIHQVVLRLASFKKIIVHADSGNVIPPFWHISLACDYRIIAENTVYQNPNADLGLVPNGGGVFFLSKLLGFSKTFEIMLSGADMAAGEALSLGLVDQVVALGEIETRSLQIAHDFSHKPPHLIQGLKRLKNYCLKDLAGYLECERDMLRETVCSAAFLETCK